MCTNLLTLRCKWGMMLLSAKSNAILNPLLFLAASHQVSDLSSATRDWTLAPHVGSTESYPLVYEGSPKSTLIFFSSGRNIAFSISYWYPRPSGLLKQKLQIWKMAEFLGDCWGNHLMHYLPSLVNVWHVLFGSQDCEVSTGGNDEKGIGGGRKTDPMLFNIPVAPISLMREQIQGSICQITPAPSLEARTAKTKESVFHTTLHYLSSKFVTFPEC